MLAGPGTAGLTAPTLDTPTVGDDQEVCVTITPDMFTEYEQTIRVQYGVGDTEPTAWLLAGTIVDPGGEVCTPPQPSGVTVWMRARREQLGYRPSAWSDPVSVAVGATTPALYSLQVTIAPDGTPTVIWDENPVALGLLIEFTIASQGVPPSYTDSVEVDATLGQYILTGETVANGETISVRATPYTGFGGGSLSGTAGTQRTASADQD